MISRRSLFSMLAAACVSVAANTRLAQAAMPVVDEAGDVPAYDMAGRVTWGNGVWQVTCWHTVIDPGESTEEWVHVPWDDATNEHVMRQFTERA